jgi:hypothetical protein
VAGCDGVCWGDDVVGVVWREGREGGMKAVPRGDCTRCGKVDVPIWADGKGNDSICIQCLSVLKREGRDEVVRLRYEVAWLKREIAKACKVGGTIDCESMGCLSKPILESALAYIDPKQVK